MARPVDAKGGADVTIRGEVGREARAPPWARQLEATCKNRVPLAAYSDMAIPDYIELHPARHWRADVRQAGFPLDHPYLEACWTPVVGPTPVALLRRAQSLWEEGSPARMPLAELARQLGLGNGTAPSSRMVRTLDRVAYFGLGVMPRPGQLRIFTEVSPVPERWMPRLPAWCRVQHERLLGAHLDGLARSAGQAPAASFEPSAAARLATRLDRIGAPTAPAPVRARSISR